MYNLTSTFSNGVKEGPVKVVNFCDRYLVFAATAVAGELSRVRDTFERKVRKFLEKCFHLKMVRIL